MHDDTGAARQFMAEAREHGFTVTAKVGYDAVVTVHKSFTPGDVGAYCAAESEANDLLLHARTVSPGSTWGTDSGSVGGHAGLTGGYMRLSKSGVSKRFANAVVKATR